MRSATWVVVACALFSSQTSAQRSSAEILRQGNEARHRLLEQMQQQQQQGDQQYSRALGGAAAVSGCRETITVGGQTINLGADIRRAGGPGPALQQLRQAQRDFQAQNGDCSRFTQVRESYQACRISKEMIDAAVRATEACAMAETQRRMQGAGGAAGSAAKPGAQALPSMDGRSEADMRNEANALAESLNGMNTADALASAAEALDALKPPPPPAKDPTLNYAGESCSYFTKPGVRPDGSGINRYANGSMVCYGDRMYQCVDDRWVDRHRCDLYGGWRRVRAEVLESSHLDGLAAQVTQPDDRSAPSAPRAENPPAGTPPSGTSATTPTPTPAGPRASTGNAPLAKPPASPPAPPPASQPAPAPSEQSRDALLFSYCVQMSRQDESLSYGVRYTANFVNLCNRAFKLVVFQQNGQQGHVRLEPRGRTSYSCEDSRELGHRNCFGIRTYDFVDP